MRTGVRRVRVVAMMVGAFIPATVVAATAAVFRDRLPDVLPVHWSGFGEADRFVSGRSLLWWMLGTAVSAGAVSVAAIAAVRRRASAMGVVALAAGVGAVAGGVWLTSAGTTLAADEPGTARLGWHVLWIPAAVTWAVVYSRLVGGVCRYTRPASVPVVAGQSSGRAAWVAVLRSGLFVTVPLAAAGVIVAVGLTVEPLILPLVVVPVVVLLLFNDLRVIVDRRGLRLIAGPFATVLKRIPLAEIVAAQAAHVDPMRWGGWGYRVMPGRSALVLRAGPGLVLRLTDGRQFAVTVDDPDTPAALLVGYRDGGT
jgi:hypothetical protein